MDRIYQFITRTTGLNLNDAHKTFVSSFVEKRLKTEGLSLEQYRKKLDEDEEELSRLIDEAAVNETYFFREEQQFDFLKEIIPLLEKEKCKKNVSVTANSDEKLQIWCAACSTGEEPVSLLALCQSLGADAEITATDIDRSAMMTFSLGRYGSNSFRDDGKNFVHLLSNIGTLNDRSFVLSPENAEKLKIKQCNLTDSEMYPFPPESVDIIFLRNVFIYFEDETRNSIMRRMEKVLKPEGIIFLSVNEIASFDPENGSSLIKKHNGKVYYLQKKSKEIIKADKNTCGKPEITDLKNKHKPFFTAESDSTKNQSIYQHKRKISEAKQDELELQKQREESQKKLDQLCFLVLSKIDSGFLDEARNIIRAYPFRPENSEYRWYFEGIIYTRQDNYDEAVKSFSRSSLFNSQFWPATFQLGLLYRKLGNEKEMKKTLSTCHNSLSFYIKEGKVCYNSIVESLSPTYFLNICDNYLNK